MDILKEIKPEIKRKIKLDENREKWTDEKFLSQITAFPNLTEEIKCYLIKRYTAIYYDNLDLLAYLKTQNINLGIYSSNLSIYLLDKGITKYFTKEKYQEFIKKFRPYFASFFLSIKDTQGKKRDNYIKRFIYLLIINEEKLINHSLNKGTTMNGIFSKNCLDTFSDEAYIKASEKQLVNIFCFLGEVPSEETKKRLNNLIINENFTTYFHNYDLMFSLFSDEELTHTSTRVEYFFTKGISYGFDLQRLLRIYQCNPDIIFNMGCLRQDIWKNLSDEEIIALSKKINFNKDDKALRNYYVKRRVLSLLPWTK